jgi:hypothetical protein
MYCPICSESTQGLNYCKRCGANLTVSAQPVESAPTVRLTGFPFALAVASMSLATAAVVLAGLGIVLSFVEDMSRQPTSGDLARMILVFGMMMITAISGLLVWQISRLVSLPRQTTSTILQAQRPPRAAVPPLVSAPSASVTENTTRNFDVSLYREPRADE